MLKKIFFLIGIILVITINSIYVFSMEESLQYVKIGLKMPMIENYKATISTEDKLSVGIWNSDFEELFTLNTKTILVRIDDFYITDSKNIILTDDIDKALIGPYHIELDGIYKNYNLALEKVNKLKDEGLNAYPVYDNGFKVWIGTYTSEEAAIYDIKKLNNSLGSAKVITDNKKRIVFEDNEGNIILLFDNSQNIHIKSSSEGKISLVNVEDYTYRDYITFNRVDRQLIVINHINIEHYLYGVVPREMSPNWPLESLKAQAIAARNYVLVSLNKHANLGYDLCDTQDCQVYGGYRWETNTTNKAVDETKGQVIKYNNKPIFAYYHSTSGGHTEDSENVWKAEVPYLRGVKDEFSLGSPNESWELVMTKEEIENKLRANNIDVGEVLAIEPLSYSENGRVLQLMIKGSENVKILEKEDVRKIFGYSYIKSTWYTINTDSDVYVMTGNSVEAKQVSLNSYPVISSNGINNTSRNYARRYQVYNGVNKSIVSTVPNVYIFNGRGWGHGLGMSQWGAKKMAELGYSYKEILEYYYTNTKVE